MNKRLLILGISILWWATGFAALTGVKTIGVDYPTLAAAIADLNAQGVGPGGVTFNIPAGYTETFATRTDGLITTNTGSASNPVVFQKSGTGANPAINGLATGPGTLDYVFCTEGADYITFDGIDVNETSGQTEYGFAVLRTDATNGSRNITIKNCTIKLNKTVTTTFGFYSNTHNAVINTPITPTDAAGTNSGLKIYSNTITDCYTGIYIAGFNDPAAPYALYDQNNEIGKDGANTITNVGGGSAIAYGIYTIYQNNLKVANNNITSSMGGSSSHYGIFLTTAKNASYDLYSNSVTFQYSGTGTSALYPIYTEMGASGSSNVVNIYNNTVSGCTYTSLTSGNVYLMQLLNLGVTTTIYGNSVSNNVIGSAGSTATGRINYIYAQKATTAIQGSVTMYDNTVTGNRRVQSSPAGGSTYFLTIGGNGGLLNLYNNTVSDNIVASNGGTYCIYASFDIGTKNVYNNTITNISKAEGTVYGLYSYNVTSNSGVSKFYNNKVSNIEGLSASVSLFGIYNSTGSGNVVNFYNNMVSDLRSPAAASGSSVYNTINGIYISSGSPVGMYNNTVYLAGTSSATNFGTTALYFSTSAKLELINNILVNNTTPKGLGKAAALRFSSINLANYTQASNYNDLYAGIPGPGNLIFFDGTNSDQTLTAFKTRVTPRDLQSVSELPPFVNVATTPFDVHLKNNVATQCESGGSVIVSPVAVTTDFDGDPRYPNPGYPVNPSFPPHAPEIGADEIGGIPSDITAPSIIYTPLGHTYNGNPRTMTAVISDGSGVPTSGTGLPVLYWMINSGSYQAAQGTFISGNTYSFTFGAGAVVGDQVSYYIAAQDLATIPNVGTYQWVGTGGYSANPPACSTPPTVPASYLIMQGISGVFHVGVGKDYTTLTAAANDINTKFISGPLTLILDDPNYPSESYPITFISNSGSSATNTLTIKPNTGVNAALVTSISSGSGLIHFKGIDHVILDGSNNGTSSNNLKIQNTGTTTGTYGIVLLNNGSADPSTNITIRNCKIQCTPVHSSVISIIPLIFSATGGDYDNCIIHNNIIIGGFDGIVLQGSTTGITDNVQITNNMIGAFPDAEAITRTGIYLINVNNTLIADNEIMGPVSGSLNVGQTGIYMSTGTTNTKIRRNKIHDFKRTSDDGWGVSGIWYASDASTVTEISNNLIYEIKSPGINPGLGQNITYGIFIRSGGNVKILHNTISLTGNILSELYDASSSCIGINYQVTGGNLEIRNNIFRNSMTTPSGISAGSQRAYGIITAVDPTKFLLIDNNDYFIDGINPAVAMKWINGMGYEGIYVTLPQWQTYIGQEANSITVDPLFTSGTNLIPTTTAMPHAGSYIPTVPQDITGINRTNPPDIGAYEFSLNPVISTAGATGISYYAATLNGSANAANTSFNLFFDYGLTAAYGNSSTAVPAMATGSSPVSMNTALSGLTGNTTYHFRARGVTSGGLTVYGNDMTFTTPYAPPTVITTAATSVTGSAATLNGTVNANGLSSAVTFEYGLTTAYGSIATATPATVTGLVLTPVSSGISGLLPNTTYHYRAKGVSSVGTTYGNDMTFTTNPIPAIVVTNFATPVGNVTATINGTVTANNSTTTASFQWGLTTVYGNTIAATPANVNGMTATAVLANLAGLTMNTTYHFRCVGVNSTGTTYGLDQTFTTSCVEPVITINGPAIVCQGTTANNYTTESGNFSYTWTVSSGGTITSGAGTNTIIVTWNGSGAQTVSVNYNNPYGCSAALPTVYNVTVNAAPVPTINGSATACVSTPGNVYTTQTGMAGYSWAVSSGGTITSGQGTSTINVTWNTTGAQTVSVNYNNASGCAAITPAVHNVTVNSIPAPTITGPTNLCANTGSSGYTTESGMTNYTWTVSAGGTITWGQGTNSINVTWTIPGAQTVWVNYSNVNGCQALSPANLNVTVNPLPGQAGAITGNSSVCAGTQGVVYSTLPINNALTYVWQVPAGAAIVSGAGTNNITVDFSAGATSGNVTVYGNNLCGNGPGSSLAVTVNGLPSASGIITGMNNICAPSSGVTYTIGPIAGATGYSWTVPQGATIVTGGNTTQITVDFPVTASSGNVTVAGTNSCGTGTASSLAVTLTPYPETPVITLNGTLLASDAVEGNQWFKDGVLIPGATSQTYDAVEGGSGDYWAVVSVNGCSSDSSNHIYVLITGQQELRKDQVSIFPVPNDGRFTVMLQGTGKENFNIRVHNPLGEIVWEKKEVQGGVATSTTIDLRPAANGLYSVMILGDQTSTVRKVLIIK